MKTKPQTRWWINLMKRREREKGDGRNKILGFECPGERVWWNKSLEALWSGESKRSGAVVFSPTTSHLSLRYGLTFPAAWARILMSCSMYVCRFFFWEGGGGSRLTTGLPPGSPPSAITDLCYRVNHLRPQKCSFCCSWMPKLQLISPDHRCVGC